MSIAQKILDLSPVGYWKLGESSGTNANDEISTNDGTYVDFGAGGFVLGEPSIVAGDAGTCVKIVPAIGGDVLFGDIFNFTGTPSFTALVFGKLIAYDSNNGHAIFNNSGANINGWGLHLGNPAIVIRAIRCDASTYDQASTQVSEGSLEGSTHLYSIVYNGTDIKVGLDGSYIATIGSTRSMTNNTDGLVIGSGYGGGSYFDGWLQHAAVFDYALTEAQLQSLVLVLDTCLPDADVTTTGWSTAPLFSKVNDASDATVITATAS